MRKILTLAMIPFLAACVATTPGTNPTSTPPRNDRPVAVPPSNPVPPPPRRSGGFRAPQVMNLPGLNGVIGASAASLMRQFGTARLDVREGDVRKLQFGGTACVLDIYLYPLREGAEPTATYLDARRASDGLDVDRASCVAALKQ